MGGSNRGGWRLRGDNFTAFVRERDEGESSNGVFSEQDVPHYPRNEALRTARHLDGGPLPARKSEQ